jgi:hypothetical protein
MMHDDVQVKKIIRRIFNDIEKFPRETGLLTIPNIDKFLVIPYSTIQEVKKKWLGKK